MFNSMIATDVMNGDSFSLLLLMHVYTRKRHAFTTGLIATCANHNYFSAVQKKIFVLNLTSKPYFMLGKFNSTNEAQNRFHGLQ
jgi:hypothetical protein